ncbi:hypothetical protein GCM10010402_06120 [Actinomadura luteofluorescens]
MSLSRYQPNAATAITTSGTTPNSPTRRSTGIRSVPHFRSAANPSGARHKALFLSAPACAVKTRAGSR